MKIVIDTNIVVSAMLMNGGAPRRVLKSCFEGRVTPIVSAALFLEYEDVLSRRSLFAKSPLSESEREELFDALMNVSEWRKIYYLWRPNLPDADDDHVVELALAGGASWIVTANLRDFSRSELRLDALRIGSAGAFLAALEDDK